MDPLSQGLLGASASQSFTGKPGKQRSAMLVGLLAGMAPDLDVLIRSANDPLLFLEFHRQFTHSLFFIPVGALLCTLILYPLLRRTLTFSTTYLYAFLGYATHGFLDGCTSYGTQLFWPFSDVRISWNVVSIIDPLFTLPVLILVFVAFARKQARYARYALAYALIYLSLGVVQRERAESVALALAQERGHIPIRLTVKPTIGNRHLWRLIYEYEGRYYVDAATVAWNEIPIHGTSIDKLDVASDYPWLPPDSTQARDIERFRWFSDGFIARNPDNSLMIMDIRYSLLPNELAPLWVIQLKPEEPWEHVDYLNTRDLTPESRQRFLEMLI
ncbi:MAG: metal-dependent hydrolase [Gammaproteobacteria bacterium]